MAGSDNKEREARSKSKENQARLNNRIWLENYRQMLGKVDKEVQPLDMSNQVNVALRDPVYGQATAAGLTSGQNMLNAWIKGANAKASADREKLANERWIRQMQLEEEDRSLRRKELAEAKQVFVPRMDLPDKDVWLDESAREEDAKRRAALEKIGKSLVARNAIEAQQIQDMRDRELKGYREFMSKQQRSMVPRNTLDYSNVDIDDIGEISEKYGVRSKGGIIDRLLSSSFHNKARREYEKLSGGNRNTVSYKNLAQYQNELVSSGNPEAANKIRLLKQDMARKGIAIKEIVGSEDKNMPLFVLTNVGVLQLTPNGQLEEAQFTVE